MATAALHAVHEHSVGFYPDPDAFVAEVGAFLATGLRQGEAVLVVATPEHQASLDRHLTDLDIDLPARRSSAGYVTFDAEGTLDRLMDGDRPDPQRFAAALGDVVLALASRGRPLRIYGEMVGVLWAAGNVTGALELEALWNDLGRRATFQLHCGYDIDGSGPEADLEVLHAICDNHTDLTTPSWSGRQGDDGDVRRSTFLPSARSLAGVRRFVRDALADWELAAVAGDAQLVASELATNAVTHAASPFEVSLLRSGSAVTLRVRDTDPTPPERREAVAHLPGGRGLGIIARLATAWGVDADAPGKAVWARFDSAA